MSPTPNAPLQKSDSPSTYVPPTPLRCLTGALISGGIGFLLYRLTASIAATFAAKPLSLSNPLAARIGALVRMLVVSVSTFATAIFAIVTLGLIALTIQLIIQRLFKRDSPSDAQ